MDRPCGRALHLRERVKGVKYTLASHSFTLITQKCNIPETTLKIDVIEIVLRRLAVQCNSESSIIRDLVITNRPQKRSENMYISRPAIESPSLSLAGSRCF